jgi:hypothetical protein
MTPALDGPSGQRHDDALEGRSDLATEVLKRLRDAQNHHDLDAFVGCFDPDYRSEQPLHPDRAFAGSEQVRANWAEVFAGVPTSTPTSCGRRMRATPGGPSGTGTGPGWTARGWTCAG